VDVGLLALAAALLAIERITYYTAWTYPDRFRAWSLRLPSGQVRGPVGTLSTLFLGFKAIQGGVYLSWCWVHGGTLVPAASGPWATTAGAALMAAGLVLNGSVFRHLGTTGVFYGNRFGHAVPWVRAFPFSWFPHPQYLGAALLVWGFFVVMRFPAPDWYAVPLVESAYYVFISRAER
jgi:hypothetical protein